MNNSKRIDAIQAAAPRSLRELAQVGQDNPRQANVLLSRIDRLTVAAAQGGELVFPIGEDFPGVDALIWAAAEEVAVR